MKILAVDGNSIINRAFYGIKLLSTKNGLYTNGVYGFISVLNRLMDMENPDGVVVAFDVSAPTFRHKKYSEYKAGRKGMPDELRSQMPLLKKLLDLMGYCTIELAGYEADDILGTIAKMADNNNEFCVIATGDRDSFQLVSDNTKVLLSSTKMGKPEINEYTKKELLEKYGTTPNGMIEIKALQGDASDNIPGVAGVGEKTAGDLIKRFGSIDYIYNNLETIDIKESVKTKLTADKEKAYLSHELGTIFCDVPIEKTMDDFLIKPKKAEQLAAFLVELEFFKMLESLDLSNVEIPQQKPKEELGKIEIGNDKTVLKTAKTVDVMLNEGDTVSLLNDKKVYNFDVLKDEDYEFLKSVLQNGDIQKRTYDSKKLYHFGIKQKIDIKGVCFDVTLAAYLINPSSSSYELDRIFTEYLCVSSQCEPEHEQIAKLNATADTLTQQIEMCGMKNLLTEIEIPLSQVLAEMEHEGFLVDTAGIEQYGKMLSERISDLQKRIWEQVGEEFNINSPKQLGVALFETLKLPCKKKTKSGYSTNADVLDSLRNEHQVVDLVLEYRTLAKLKSTYCDGLVAAADLNSKIHSTLNQTETRTGRISSLEPNLQNIPVRRPEGKELRRFFKARPGYMLCDADYSQIELRVLAHIADDETMINAFLNGVDIHTLTASQVFDMPVEMVTPLMRSRAKAVNFGIVYGIGAFSLSKDIGVTRKEAESYINGYLQTYNGVKTYMDFVVDKAKQDGFVTTVYGRRRMLPELRATNGMMRSFGERIARNMPIQGTAADIIKIAMIRVNNRLKAELPLAKLIMQVHDELIIEAPKDQIELASTILKQEMENAVLLKVPMSVDVHSGATWYEAKE